MSNLVPEIGRLVATYPQYALILGSIFCFLGWPIFRPSIALQGFIIGAYFGMRFAQAAGYGSSQVTVVALAALVGLILAGVALSLIGVYAFLYGFLLGFWSMIFLGLNGADVVSVTILAPIVGIIAGFVVVRYLDLGVIVVTAFFGASLVVEALQQMGRLPPIGSSTAVTVGLAMLGILVQYAISQKM